jgi:hypothetical protein
MAGTGTPQLSSLAFARSSNSTLWPTPRAIRIPLLAAMRLLPGHGFRHKTRKTARFAQNTKISVFFHLFSPQTKAKRQYNTLI